MQDIHCNIFGQIFDCAGEFRTIQMVKYEYLERIFFDAIIGEDNDTNTPTEIKASKYDTIGEYKVKEYKERPHKYKEE